MFFKFKPSIDIPNRTHLLKRHDLHRFRVILLITHLFSCKHVKGGEPLRKHRP